MAEAHVIYPAGQADGYAPFFFKPYQSLARRVPIFPALGNHADHTQRGGPLYSVTCLVSTPVPAPGVEHGAPLFLPAIWKGR
jgi:hypothetical protein